jgi:hypothetical protein
MQDIPLDRAIALLLGLLVIAAVMVAYVWTIFWAYRDGKARGKSGVLVALLVALLHPWPLGLVLWYIFRPSYPYYTRPHSRYPADDGAAV